MTTCQSDNITWDYTGPSPAQLTLQITDIYVNQSPTATPPPTVNMTLSANISASDESWYWEQVDVPPGYYIVQGSVLDADSQSNSFFVANGSDTSCLSTTNTTQSPTPSPAPVSGSSKKTNIGAIVGGVVGGVVLIGFVLAALLLLHKSGRSQDRRPAAVGRWGGLGSTDDGDPFSGGKITTEGSASRGHGQSESTAGILNDIGPAIATAVTTRLHDDIDSTEDEKNSPTTPASVPDLPPVLPYTAHHRRTSTTSSLHNQTRQPRTSSTLERDSIAMPVIATHTDARRRGSLDVVDHGRSPPAPRTARLSQPFMNSPDKKEILSPEINRSTLGGAGGRRASRKPVPQYDVSDIEADAAWSDLSNIGGRSPFSPPPIDSHFPNSSTNSSNNPNHKSSPGDPRSLHYLIPDSPPAGK